MKKLLLFSTFILTSLVSGNSYAKHEDHSYCREYTQTFTVGTKTQAGYGTACLQEDGSWRIVSDSSPQNNIKYIVKEKEVRILPREKYYHHNQRWAFNPFFRIVDFGKRKHHHHHSHKAHKKHYKNHHKNKRTYRHYSNSRH